MHAGERACDHARGGAGGSTMGLLSKHRQARELLSRSASTGVLPAGAAGSRPPRPWSAVPASVGGSGVNRSSSAAALGLCREVRSNPYAAPVPGSGTGGGNATSSSAGPRPASAGHLGRDAKVTQEFDDELQSRRSGAAFGFNVHALPRQGRSLIPPSHSNSALVPPPLPPLPDAETFSRRPMSAGGASALRSRQLAAAARGVQVQSSAAATVSPSASLSFSLESKGDEGTEHDGSGGVGDPCVEDVGEAELDFTVEELRLEKEIEQSLNELEAADAAAAALRQQLENAVDDVDVTRRELAQLQGVVANWEKAVEDGRRELAERQQRLEDLLAVIPPAAAVLPASAGGSCGSTETEEAAATAAAVSSKREALESRRVDLAAERAHVLEGQVARLQDQVVEQQNLLQRCLEEKQRLRQQVETLEQERDAIRASQREARASSRVIEEQLKTREKGIVACTSHRQALERQVVQLRGEANGLRVRLDKGSAASGATSSASAANIRPAGGHTPRINATETSATCSADGVEAGAGVEEADAEADAEEARAMSLRLQREIVDLWAELRRCDEEAKRLQHVQLTRSASDTVPDADAK